MCVSCTSRCRFEQETLIFMTVKVVALQIKNRKIFREFDVGSVLKVRDKIKKVDYLG
jgi:hypothetical protein